MSKINQAILALEELGLKPINDNLHLIKNIESKKVHTYSKCLPLFEQEGFIICFEALPEVDMTMHHLFIYECDWSEEEYLEIADYAWFCAKVSAWKDGIEVATDYLGACSYKTIKEFYTTYKDDYFADMVSTVIKEGKLHV